ncbi:unnamed protein product [marine sediment metagenome]|uniref:Uncharacterized protein n=1 Tax=marine sediment metagenome TaxID=412755 RepID=X1PE34_9ZZZZ
MNIEPIAKTAMEFLKENIPSVCLGTTRNIGEIFEVEWESHLTGGKGSVFVTVDNPRVVGFKKT